jgi:hypothetical protein
VVRGIAKFVDGNSKPAAGSLSEFYLATSDVTDSDSSFT